MSRPAMLIGAWVWLYLSLVASAVAGAGARDVEAGAIVGWGSIDWFNLRPPQDLTNVVEAFRAAAVRAHKAGFDGVGDGSHLHNGAGG